MLLVTLACQRFDVERNEFFNRKNDMFPFITKESAKRTSIKKEDGNL